VLSTVWSGGKLGVAYYDTQSSQIHLMMDIVETNEFEIIKRGMQIGFSGGDACMGKGIVIVL